ncbi:hypothetical protein N9N67_10200 [Bacteriovoracaceae bacterium]|nr:hypothetical protein [Bacteriovoracaceae bacterium]
MNRERLEEIIQTNHGEENTFPFLANNSEKNVFKKYFEWLADKVAEWIKSDLNTSVEEIKIYLQIILIILAFIIAYFIYKRIKNKSFNPTFRSNKVESVAEKPTSLYQELENALKEKNYSKASRLKWKLFIKGKKLSPSTTPLQLMQKNKFEQQRIYSLMFNKEKNQTHLSNEWNWLDQFLNKQ